MHRPRKRLLERGGFPSHVGMNMQNLWNDSDAAAFCGGDLSLRVHTSRLLGREPQLVLHGGGNTSVKSMATDFFGDAHEVLYIKGSGGDLATIDAGGFPAVGGGGRQYPYRLLSGAYVAGWAGMLPGTTQHTDLALREAGGIPAQCRYGDQPQGWKSGRRTLGSCMYLRA